MKHSKRNMFENLSQTATVYTGTTKAFIIACSIVVTWLLTGPLFHFSDTWQFVSKSLFLIH